MTDTKLEEKVEFQGLTALDRCDSCGAAAQARATFVNGYLFFCGHHARKHKDKLSSAALAVYYENKGDE